MACEVPGRERRTVLALFCASALLGFFAAGPAASRGSGAEAASRAKFASPPPPRATPGLRPLSPQMQPRPYAEGVAAEKKKKERWWRFWRDTRAAAAGAAWKRRWSWRRRRWWWRWQQLWKRSETVEKQDFLEFDPYHDRSSMPLDTYSPKDPFEATVVSVKRIVGSYAPGETYSVIIDHGGNMSYVEGQSYGVLPPGRDSEGRPHKVRLYSIASSRYGDDMSGKTTTLCVRRPPSWGAEAKDPAKTGRGACSSYLCDASAGDVVRLTGPTGKVMLLPEDKPDTDIIMVATGTGIAPMRSFLKRMFVEDTPYRKDFKGLAWLFFGAANTDSLLYDEELKNITRENPDHFRYDVALSREQKNKDGGKMYIQYRVAEHSDEVFDRLERGAHIYFCGRMGMMPGVQLTLERAAEKRGIDHRGFVAGLKRSGQWHAEVY